MELDIAPNDCLHLQISSNVCSLVMSKHAGQDESAAAWDLSYSAGSGVFDEMYQGPSTPRPHWRPLIESLQRLGRHELQSRWENGRRIIREHGVSYNTYGSPDGTDRPWGLDLVPLLVTGEEWARIEAGLIQRLRLLNLILADIYGGSQRLLRDGFLPPELIYANPGFLRPCRGVQVVSRVYLHLLACDLGRSPDGQWWVLSDRAQSPSGAGYAWENRTVLSRILPEQIRDCQAQQLSAFFQRQRDMLLSLAPPGRKQPSIALLTPGPQSGTYFEHAYLARNLGFPLVEGADLTVRERRVFLKTIEGLQPVDVILRRLDDALCDPLELRGDCSFGVSGLIEAARAGNVTVANALGAGLLESPAFMAFLPNLCRHLLGEELLLPSVATWWCGQAKELRYVLGRLESLTLKPAFVGQTPVQLPVSSAPSSRRKLSERRKNLLAMIEAAPRDFVAQERVKLSRAPAWVDDRLTARAVVIRAFAACGSDSFGVLPGGLTRVSKNPNDVLWTIQSGSDSKDTWVLSDDAANGTEPTHFFNRQQLTEQVVAGVPSRAADHLFWLGRYIERLEQLLRVLRCILARASGETGGKDSPERRAITELATNLGLLPELPGEAAWNEELWKHMLLLLYDADEPGAVRELLKRIRVTASAVRDRFSGDTWRILGRLEADARTRPGRLPLASATALSHDLVLDLAAFSGMEMENMTRGSGWRFLDFGRRLERGLSVVKLIQAAVSVKTHPAAVLETVLEIADSVMTYRRQYFAAPQLPRVLDLVLRDESNPRSLAFQVKLLSEHAAALTVDSRVSSPESEQARIKSLAAALREADMNRMSLERAQGPALPLLDVLENWAADLAAVSDEVTNRYFSHSVPRVS
jgi:uncharacterized circularly permuted ATP-grasp superfamily protein/uncharacterized alpha-E superfamily protein